MIRGESLINKPTIEILEQIKDNARKNKEQAFTRLYRYMLRPDIYHAAYERLYPGRRATDKLHGQYVGKIIQSLLDETYSPKIVRTGSAPLSDYLVAEALCLILAAVYEPILLPYSCCLQSQDGRHAALTRLKKQFAGMTWLVAADLSEYLGTIDYKSLAEALRMKVKDARLIKLIWQFLKAGYMLRPYSNRGISPLLADIYLHKLDNFAARTATQFFRHATTPGKNMQYIRYGGEFIIGIKGTKASCHLIKQQLADFITNSLSVELPEEKMPIAHNSQNVRFLGYDIRLRARSQGGRVELCIPFDDIVTPFLFSKGAVIQTRDGVIEPAARKYLYSRPDWEILSVFNSELEHMCRYFVLADNYAKLQYFAYLMEYSCLKTLAGKHKTTVRKIAAKYRDSTDGWSLPCKNAVGEPRQSFQNIMNFRVKPE